MEVHPAHGSIHSVKEFMVHLLAITIGLLLALGLEASVEWVHHRHLVQSARENISQEIHNNQQSLASELNALPVEEQQLKEILSVVSNTQYGRTTKPIGTLTWTVIRLNESAWNTTFSTGAIAYMDYDEVKRYSQLYALQQLYNSTMERNLESRGEMYAFLSRMEIPEKPPNAEFESGKHAITSEIVMVQFLREMGGKLSTNYADLSPQSK